MLNRRPTTTTDARRISYYKGMKGTPGQKEAQIYDCTPAEFEGIAKAASVFESIPNDALIKPYFDIDHKYKEDFELFDADRTASGIHELNKRYLTSYYEEKTGITPIFAAAESHFARRKISKKGGETVDYWGYSYHLVITNITSDKPTIKADVKQINARILADQARPGPDKYADYLPIGDTDKPFEAFDPAPYGDGAQKIRCVYASKPGETRPFNVFEGTFEDMVITGFIDPAAVHYAPVAPAKTTPAKPAATPAAEEYERKYNRMFVEKCFEEGMFFTDAKSSAGWRKMGLNLKGYFGDTEETYGLFDTFSKLAGAPHYTPEDNRDIWDGLAANPDKYGNFGLFVNLAKADNPAKYKQIADVIKNLKKGDKPARARGGALLPSQITPEMADEIAEIVARYLPIDIETDAGGVDFILDKYPGKFLWINGVLHSWTGERWETGTNEFLRCLTEPAIELIAEIGAKAAEEMEGGTDAQRTALLKIKDKIYTASKAWRTRRHLLEIVKLSEAFCTDNSVKFDVKDDLFGFTNGVYDLIAHQFRPYEPTDYMTINCGHAYNPDIDPDRLAELETLFESIIPDAGTRDLLLEVMSTGLTGRAPENFVLLNGTGRNGKGLGDEFLLDTLGAYGTTANVSILTEKDSTGGNPEKAKLHKKRFVIMKEPDAGQPLQNDRIKDITGGGEISGRLLYSNDTVVKLNLTLAMECNERPKFKEAPGHAEGARVIDIYYPNRFSTDPAEIDGVSVFLADAKYKTAEWRAAHRAEFFYLLTRAYRRVQANNGAFRIPAAVKERTEGYLNQSYPILTFFEELYEKTEAPTDALLVTDIARAVRATDTFIQCYDKKEKRAFTDKKFKEFFETHKLFREAYKDRKKIGGRDFYSVLIGYRLREVQYLQELPTAPRAEEYAYPGTPNRVS